MAINIDVNGFSDESADKNPETMFIKAGNRLARFVSYVELGKHVQKFKGAPAVYETGKKAGCKKPPILHVALLFEFPGEEHTGDYPLCIGTTRQMQTGEFFDAVTVPESLAAGTMKRAYAMRTRFVKYLTAMQAATGRNYMNFSDFAKERPGVMINVTNKLGPKAEDGSQRTYANMKPEGIVPPRFEHPASGDIQELEVPPATGEYCTSFEWDAPTPKSWTSLPTWHKATIKAAVNFDGSPTYMMLLDCPELDALTEPGKDQDQSRNDLPEPPSDPMEQEDIPL